MHHASSINLNRVESTLGRVALKGGTVTGFGGHS